MPLRRKRRWAVGSDSSDDEEEVDVDDNDKE